LYYETAVGPQIESSQHCSEADHWHIELSRFTKRNQHERSVQAR